MIQTMSITIVMLICLTLAACSTEEPEEKTALRIEQEKIAAQAVEDIKAPINHAQLAKEITEQHNKKMEELLESQ